MSKQIIEPKKRFTGRREIFTSFDEITSENILEVLHNAIPVHEANAAEIKYLEQYRKGDVPIFTRKKDVRPEINNTVNENRADEIVNFKTGYLVGEPIQYVTRKGLDAKVTDEIILLNELMDAESRDTADIELADWLHVCGIGYKMVQPDPDFDEDEAPFEIYAPHPADTFVIKSSGLGHKPMLGVSIVTSEELGVRKKTYYCYAKNRIFIVEDGVKLVSEEPTVFKDIPIVEYKINNTYLGAFEPVLTLLDAINTCRSNQLDGVEQFIQALMVFKGADIDDESFKALRELGALKVPEGGDVDYLVQQLSQSDTKTLVDGLYQDVLTIVGMPNRNGGSSTSDTGTAVIMRDGWSDAEARAKISEKFFKKSERKFLKLILKIVGIKVGIELKQSDIDIRFTRRNYENITSKANVLIQMLSNDKIHPKLAYESCGMFVDPTLAYEESMAHYEEQLNKEAKELEESFNAEKDNLNGGEE